MMNIFENFYFFFLYLNHKIFIFLLLIISILSMIHIALLYFSKKIISILRVINIFFCNGNFFPSKEIFINLCKFCSLKSFFFI